MEPRDEKASTSRVESSEHNRNVEEPNADAQSTLNVEIPPWAETYEISATDMDGESRVIGVRNYFTQPSRGAAAG